MSYTNASPTSDSYTKAQENALLAAKANKAITFSMSETDTLLAEKQDVIGIK